MMNYALTIKKTQSALRSHWAKLAILFWVWLTFLRPTMRNGLLFQHYSCKPKFHHLWQCSLKVFISSCTDDKLSTDINTILFLIFTQQAQYKFGCNMMHAQIFSENLMKRGFWTSNFLCYFTNGQTMFGMNHFLNFLDDFFIFLCWRSSWMFNVLKWSLAPFKMFVQLMSLCSTHGFVLKCLF